jgi:nitrile hydratase
MVREPRALLAEMGCELPSGIEIRVWDSSAEVRYLVLPERPQGTDGLTRDELAGLVTRDAMIGVSRL